jgi:long-chain acyl-CoA synthetase
VLGDNRPEWLVAELAVQCLGGAVVGVYPSSVGEEIAHVLTLAEARVVVAEDQEQVDKLLQLQSQLPKLTTIVYYDPRGLSGYPHDEHPCLAPFTDVEAAGARDAGLRPDWLDARVAEGRPDDTAVVCTTVGTTARPRLAELSHANIVATAEHLARIDPLPPGCRYVSFLPLAWVGEQLLAVGCGLRWGLTLSFPEDAATWRADLREIGPDVVVAPPRFWESMLAEVRGRVDEAGRVKRRVFGWAYAVGDRTTSGTARAVADAVALRPARDRLGLSRTRRCYVWGAVPSPDVLRFFRAIGVDLKQVYGQTESCGIAVAHRDDDVRLHTVGAPIPGTELRIGEDGEILLRSAGVFRGYLNDPEASAAAVDAEGWLHTGDAGHLDDGQLVVVDRRAGVRTLPDGTRFSHAFVENRMKLSPYVAEAVTFHGASGVTAIVRIDPVTVGAWAGRDRVSHRTDADLAGRPAVAELLAGELARANAGLPEAIRVRRFVLLHELLGPDDDEITGTGEDRRRVVADRYAGVVAALDGEADAVEVRAAIAERSVTLAIHRPVDAGTPAGRSPRPLGSGRA